MLQMAVQPSGRMGPAWIILPPLLASCAGGPPEAPPPTRPVLLTTDAGCEVDDQWALAHLLLAAEGGGIDFHGVVTTHAPTLKPPAAESSASVAREVIGVVRPLAQPPVLAGRSRPLPGGAPAGRPTGGPAGEPPGEPAGGTVEEGIGARFIVEISKGFHPQRRLTVITIGAATDVAAALLIDPGLAERIEVVSMAFDGWPNGGDHWNVKNDPRAYRVILESGAPLVIGAADVCLRHLTIDEEESLRRTQGGGAPGGYLAARFMEWLGREEKLCRDITGRRAWPIWDLVVVAHLLGMTTWEDRPRPRLKDDLTFELENPQGTLRWITAIDSEKLWQDFQKRLGKWAGRRQEGGENRR